MVFLIPFRLFPPPHPTPFAWLWCRVVGWCGCLHLPQPSAGYYVGTVVFSLDFLCFFFFIIYFLHFLWFLFCAACMQLPYNWKRALGKTAQSRCDWGVWKSCLLCVVDGWRETFHWEFIERVGTISSRYVDKVPVAWQFVRFDSIWLPQIDDIN